MIACVPIHIEDISINSFLSLINWQWCVTFIIWNSLAIRVSNAGHRKRIAASHVVLHRQARTASQLFLVPSDRLGFDPIHLNIITSLDEKTKELPSSFFFLFSHFAFSSNSKKSLILIAPNFPLFVSRLEVERAQARARRPEDSKTWSNIWLTVYEAQATAGQGLNSPYVRLSSDLAQRPITSNFFILDLKKNFPGTT